jgi:hypothetical protein
VFNIEATQNWSARNAKSVFQNILLAYISYFEEKIKAILHHHGVCVPVNPLSIFELNLYETWYVYHDI